MIGRRVDVTADLEQVTVTASGVPVARHDLCWAKHQTITGPGHRTAAAILRQHINAEPAEQTAVQ
ncbi:hypothetical protein ACFOZ4_35130 [Hamadaea flava]|uniref:Transposase for insertion sequence element IS21-like C-terminal domain-containing protein n=1 Tax=Hamadaea flava TaxID=1742688 RepID=A0ABV8M1B9_9ACTN